MSHNSISNNKKYQKKKTLSFLEIITHKNIFDNDEDEQEDDAMIYKINNENIRIHQILQNKLLKTQTLLELDKDYMPDINEKFDDIDQKLFPQVNDNREEILNKEISTSHNNSLSQIIFNSLIVVKIMLM